MLLCRYVDVRFETFAPWQQHQHQQQQQVSVVIIEAPSLLLNGSLGLLSGVTLPAVVRFSRDPAEKEPMLLAQGSRFVRVSGDGVLPLKRWVVVTQS